jgi:hypothetical protein
MEEVAICFKEGPTGGKSIIEGEHLFDHYYVRKLTYVMRLLPLVSP